jgi:hypothetical protein
MRLLKTLGAAAAALVLAGAPALANPKNALDAYVAKPDPAFGWKVARPISGPGYHGAVLELTSQGWLTSKEVDHPVWKHWLTVIVPDKVAYRTGFLFITGGKIDDPVPEKPTDRFVQMALETNSVVSELDDVPNQPLRFTEDPKPRVEDEIIAYQQAKFAKDRNRPGPPGWSARSTGAWSRSSRS